MNAKHICLVLIVGGLGLAACHDDGDGRTRLRGPSVPYPIIMGGEDSDVGPDEGYDVERDYPYDRYDQYDCAPDC